jgi:hypothetical protein
MAKRKRPIAKQPTAEPVVARFVCSRALPPLPAASHLGTLLDPLTPPIPTSED